MYEAEVSKLEGSFGKKKILPKGYEKEALLALSHYPELKDVRIEFRLVEDETPFITRPTVGSTMIRSGNERTYLILISTKSERLQRITIGSLPQLAQVGVLGHELSHVSDFTKRNVLEMVRVTFGNLSNAYMKTFEMETDRRAILHGLGCELLAWSSYVRRTKPVGLDGGSKEMNNKGAMIGKRYMIPDTIRNVMLKARLAPCEN